MTRAFIVAACIASAIPLLSCSQGPERPNVVLIILDTVRADHMSCYGYGRGTTPHIDSLAGAGTVFMRCQAQSSWTLPATASIMTGLSPREHFAGFRGGAFYGIDPNLDYLPALFNSHGYETAAFMNVVFLSEDFGFHRGFDHFDCQGFAGEASERRALQTTNDFLEWLDGAGDAPFFAVVHYYDPHMRYEPPAPYDTLFTDPSYEGEFVAGWGGLDKIMAANSGAAEIPLDGLCNLMALYDGEIAYTDAAVGDLLRGLRSRGLASSTLVVVVADHGEEFMEHGCLGHGNNMFQTVTHLPLVISGPGFEAGLEDARLCSQMDLFPTLASACGLEAPDGLPGRSLSADSPGGPVPASGILWAQHDVASVVDGMQKTVWIPGDSAAAVYDLAADPAEMMPIPAGADDASAVMEYWATPQIGRPEQVAFREAVDRALRGLGYIR